MKNEFYTRFISSILLIPLVLFIIIHGGYLFITFISICFLITCYEWHLMTNKKSYNKLGYFFLIFSFLTVYLIRNSFEDKSLSFFLLVITICISTDIGGYIFGKIIKGPKLVKKISPNKTYSGMFGGFLLSVLTIVLINNNFNSFLIELNIYSFPDILIILLISLVSQIGDIILSYFKRLSNVKDTGKLIPGHGGILDRIDGMIFAFPLSFIIFTLGILR